MMPRFFLIAASMLMMSGTAMAQGVDYRITVTPDALRVPVLVVEVRLRGDADGETRLTLPASGVSEATVSGGAMSSPDDRHRLLRHRPGAKLTVRYRLRAPGAGPDRLAVAADAVLAVPADRPSQPATLRWSRLPRGWQSVSDLNSSLVARPSSVADIDTAILMAGPGLEVAERAIPGGVLHAALFGDAAGVARLADIAAPPVSAQRTFWNDTPAAFLVAAGFDERPARARGLLLPTEILTRSDPSDTITQALTRSWIPTRLGGPSADPAISGLMEGLASLYADRIRVRAGLLPHSAAVSTLTMADTRGDTVSRGIVLALKWDEDIRRKSAGRLDFDDVVLRMADHYRRFPSGLGPDVITGLVSAAWVAAGIDLRPDIARYAQGTAAIPLPETMFDNCLDARVTVAPGFDAGFDAAGSFAAKTVRGVRRGGPAWNSGLRNGMTLENWAFNAGDMMREIELNIRPETKRARPRKIRFWPYGDVDVETRKLQMAVGLSDVATAACARKIGGL